MTRRFAIFCLFCRTARKSGWYSSCQRVRCSRPPCHPDLFVVLAVGYPSKFFPYLPLLRPVFLQALEPFLWPACSDFILSTLSPSRLLHPPATLWRVSFPHSSAIAAKRLTPRSIPARFPAAGLGSGTSSCTCRANWQSASVVVQVTFLVQSTIWNDLGSPLGIPSFNCTLPRPGRNAVEGSRIFGVPRDASECSRVEVLPPLNRLEGSVHLLRLYLSILPAFSRFFLSRIRLACLERLESRNAMTASLACLEAASCIRLAPVRQNRSRHPGVM